MLFKYYALFTDHQSTYGNVIMLFKYYAIQIFHCKIESEDSEVYCEPWKAAIDYCSEVCLLVI